MLQRPNNLSYEQRVRIFDKVCREVTKHYFDPNFNGTDWPKQADARRMLTCASGVAGTGRQASLIYG